MWVEIDVSTRPCSDSFFFAFSSFLLSLKNNILKLQFGLERSKENRIDSDVLTCKAGVFCSVNDDTTSPNFLLIATSKKSRCTDEVCKLLLPSSATIKTCDVSCCQWSQSTNSQRRVMSSPGHEIQSFFTSYLVPHFSEVWKCGVVWKSKDIVALFPQS